MSPANFFVVGLLVGYVIGVAVAFLVTRRKP